MKTHSLNNLFSDIFIFFVGTVLAKVIQFVLLPLYTSYMTADAYGMAELVNNLSELFLPIVSFCLYDAVLRFTIEGKHNEIVISSAIRVLLLSFGVAIPITITVYLIWNCAYIYIFLFIVYAYSMQRLFACYVRGKGYSKVYALSGAVNAIFVTFFSVYFLVIINFGIKGYLLAIGLGYFTSAIYLFLAGKIYKDIKWNRTSTMVVKEMVSFSAPLIPYNIMYFFLTLAGRYILLWIKGEAAVGLYAAAIKISAVINMLQQAVSTALQLNVSQEYVNKNREKYYSYLFNLFYAGYWTLASYAICLCPLLAKLLLKNEFYEAHIYLPTIMFVAILNCLSAMYGTMFQAYKVTRKNVPIVCIGMTINIVICLILVPRYGIWGVCIASFMSYLSQIVIKIRCINSFCKIRYNWNNMAIFPLAVIFQVITAIMLNGYFEYIFLIIFAILESLYLVYVYMKEIRNLKEIIITKFMKKSI